MLSFQARKLKWVQLPMSPTGQNLLMRYLIWCGIHSTDLFMTLPTWIHFLEFNPQLIQFRKFIIIKSPQPRGKTFASHADVYDSTSFNQAKKQTWNGMTHTIARPWELLAHVGGISSIYNSEEWTSLCFWASALSAKANIEQSPQGCCQPLLIDPPL